MNDQDHLVAMSITERPVNKETKGSSEVVSHMNEVKSLETASKNLDRLNVILPVICRLNDYIKLEK